MRDQNYLRNKLTLYLAKTGVKQMYISTLLGINKCIFSQFKRGYRDLNPEHYDDLDNYLDKQYNICNL